jgi:hypothetical protein
MYQIQVMKDAMGILDEHGEMYIPNYITGKRTIHDWFRNGNASIGNKKEIMKLFVLTTAQFLYKFSGNSEYDKQIGTLYNSIHNSVKNK